MASKFYGSHFINMCTEHQNHRDNEVRQPWQSEIIKGWKNIIYKLRNK